MEANKKKVNISCPKCGQSKVIGIPESIFADKKFGSIKVQVPKGAVCTEHQFVTFFSNKGNIIGYDVIDASTLTEKSEPTEAAPVTTLSLKYLIHKFGFNCVAGFLHAKIFDYPSFIIKDSAPDVDADVLNQTFDTIIPPILKNENHIGHIQFDNYVFPNPFYFYTTTKSKRNNAYLINDRRLVIHMPWNTSIDFEKKILEYALEHENYEEEKKHLRHHINQFIKAVEICKIILSNSKMVKEKELVKALKEQLIVTTINKQRIMLIKEYLERRDSPELAAKIKI